MTHASFRIALLLGSILVVAPGCEESENSRGAKAPLVLLGQQRPLTDKEYAGTLEVWGQAKKSYQERQDYLKSKGLDQALYIPGLGWNDEVTNPFREFLGKKPSRERANQLRFHTQSFTGYSLYHLAQVVAVKEKGTVPDPVPVAEFDAKYRGRPIEDYLLETFLGLRKGVPEKYLPRVPRVMGEIGWDIDGYTVSWDTVAYLDMMSTLYRAGILGWIEKRIAAGRPVTVLEIGSGYGGFPYVFQKAFPRVSYWGCDLAEAIGVAGMYLSVTLPDHWRGIYPDCGACSGEGMFLIANHRFEEFVKRGQKVDLAINMMSLSEMPEAQIKYYGQRVSELLANEGVFFEVNYDLGPQGWSNAKKHMPAYFKASEDLGASLNRGRIHLWANDPALLSAIKAERGSGAK